MTHIYIITEAV